MSFLRAAGLFSRMPRPPPESSPPALSLEGSITREDIPALCERARALIEDRAHGPLICDVGALDGDAVTVDALARLQLTALRLGSRVRISDASPQLRRLICLAGLGEVLPCVASGLEPRGQAEEREEACGVQEERDPGDPAA